MEAEDMKDPTTTPKHTPEPWRAYVDDPYRGPDPQDRYDTDTVYSAYGPICRMSGDVKFSYHDARRIVACVNALAGLNPEGVRECVDALEKTVAAYDRIGGPLATDPQHAANRAALAKLREVKP
jgi:hypothetical protein